MPDVMIIKLSIINKKLGSQLVGYKSGSSEKQWIKVQLTLLSAFPRPQKASETPKPLFFPPHLPLTPSEPVKNSMVYFNQRSIDSVPWIKVHFIDHFGVQSK